jgi:archaellum component FlaC
MGIMSNLDIEFKNAPDHIRFLKHEIERLEKRVSKLEKKI